MKIVVTGAAGYIGVPAVARLLAAGYEVHELDCLRPGGAKLLGSYLTGRFTVIRGGIRAVAQEPAGADTVAHLGVVDDPARPVEPALAEQLSGSGALYGKSVTRYNGSPLRRRTAQARRANRPEQTARTAAAPGAHRVQSHPS